VSGAGLHLQAELSPPLPLEPGRRTGHDAAHPAANRTWVER
jgi:hypothetical protein